ncbi:MAG TPA: hypothetical protein VK172_09095 [Lentimicrobium sp.]|nr:hypothetical protein [Lentimicrobium sp.]
MSNKITLVTPEPDEPKKTISRHSAAIKTGAAIVAGIAVSNSTGLGDIVEIETDAVSGADMPETGIAGLSGDSSDAVVDSASDDSWDPNTAPIAKAGTVHDGMSFEEAFAAAREDTGPGGVFAWHGEYYNTFYAEELDENGQPSVDFITVEAHGLPEVEYAGNAESEGSFEGNENLNGDGDNGGLSDSEDASNGEYESAPNVISADLNSDGETDTVFVDLNLDGSADALYTDQNNDGQLSEEDLVMIHDPSTLVMAEVPADGSTISVDTNADGMDDVIVGDVNADQVADVIGSDDNRNQVIEENELQVLNPDAMEGLSVPESEIEYSGEVASDVPEDVTADVLDGMEDDMTALDDDFGELNEWS